MGAVADQFRTGIALEVRVGIHADKFGQNGLIDFLLEGLCLVFIFLTLSLDTMTKDFVKENGAGATESTAGPVSGSARAPSPEPAMFHHMVHVLDNGFVGWEAFRAKRHVGLVEWQFHAVLGLGGRRNNDAKEWGGDPNAAAIAVYVAARFDFRDHFGAIFDDLLMSRERAVNLRIFVATRRCRRRMARWPRNKSPDLLARNRRTCLPLPP